MEISRATMKKLIFLIFFAAVSFSAFQWLDSAMALIRFLMGVFSPFLIGAALAFILNVPMRYIESKLFPGQIGTATRRRKRLPAPLKRGISLLLTFLLLIVVVLLLVLVVVPELVTTVIGLGETIQAFAIRILTWAQQEFANNPEIVQYLQSLTIDWRAFDWKGILTSVVDFLKDGAGNMLSSTISAAKGLISSVATGLIAFIFSCYLLLQKEKLGLQFRKAIYALLPEKVAAKTISIFSLSNRIFSSFITGQCTEAVILGGMFFVVMTLLKMPYALLVGCLIAVTALIPIVGAFIGCAIGAFLLLMTSPMQALIFVIVFLILQQIEGNLIYPHVVGSSVGLPSIWVLVAVTVGGSLMGIVGMLIFIPLISVVYTLFREFVYSRLKEKRIIVK